MGCRYSPQRSQSNGKSNFQNELTNQKYVSNSKLNLAYRQHHNVKPSLFFISNRFYRTLNNFVHLNGHVITEFTWVVTMAPAMHSGDIWRWTVTSHWHRQDDCNCGIFAISEHTNQFLGLCNINEWRRGHRSHTLACFGRNFVCHVTYLLISPQENPRFELSYRGYLQYPVEFKIVRTEKLLRTEPPSRTCPSFRTKQVSHINVKSMSLVKTYLFHHIS